MEAQVADGKIIDAKEELQSLREPFGFIANVNHFPDGGKMVRNIESIICAGYHGPLKK